MDECEKTKAVRGPGSALRPQETKEQLWLQPERSGCGSGDFPSVLRKLITCPAAVSAIVSTPLGATGFNEEKLSSGFSFFHLGLLRTFH